MHDKKLIIKTKQILNKIIQKTDYSFRMHFHGN